MSEHYTQAVVDEVLARTDLRSVVEPYVKLVRRGGRFFGCCPFHDEKTPSFSVSPDQGLFYCFGCAAGGSALQFLMRIEGWSFPEALQELANRAGVRLPERSRRSVEEARSEKTAREQYVRVMETATVWFEAELVSGRHPQAQAYLEQRGVDESTRRRFRLGFAPSGWEGLLRALARKKMAPEAVAEAGLALPSKRGGYYDRFRNRLMFPVPDRLGGVVAFSGRALDPEERAKYVNSPEHPFFKKGEHLFGLHAAKTHLSRAREAILVEGNFDVVTLHAAGFGTTVAPLGTAMTAAQVRLLTRVADRVVLAFDGDEAGQRAMNKCLGPCYAAGLEVRAVPLPDGADPDSIVREQGAEAFTELLGKARPLAELALDGAITSAAGGGPEERVRAARAAGRILSLLPQGAVRRRYREDVARRLDLSVRDVSVEPGRARRAPRQASEMGEDPAPPAGEASRPLSSRERLLVQLLVDEPRLARRFVESEPLDRVLRADVRAFVERWAAASSLDVPERLERIVDELETGIRGGILEAVAAEREYEPTVEPLYEQLVWRLQADLLQQEVTRTRELLRAAEQQGDQARAAELIQQSVTLAKAKARLGHHPPRA